MSKHPIAAFAADIHWRMTTPEYRRETCPFNEVIAKKLGVFAAYLREHDIPGFVAGDTFDISRDFMSMWTFKKMMFEDFWRKNGKGSLHVYAVPGQHDRFHHNKDDMATSLNEVFDAGGAWEPFPADGVGLSSGDMLIRVYGAGWHDPIPVPERPEIHNVLVLHETLWHRTPVYPGQTAGNVAVESVRLHDMGYKTVFSGDNHMPFDVRLTGVDFHNIGAFTRTDVDQAGAQPRFCILFDDLSVESVYVGEKDVFEMERSDADKGREDAKDAFSEALAGGFDYGDTFKGNLEKTANSGRCGEAVLTPAQCDILKDVVNAI